MRPSSIALFVLLGSSVSLPALGADPVVAPLGAAQPYDAPSPAPAADGAPSPDSPAVAKPVPRALPPLPAPQASDDEAPRRGQLRQVAQNYPLDPEPYAPTEPGLVLVETLLGFLALDGATAVAVEASPWLILAAPFATGGVVCLIGSTSQYFDGSCAAAIGGSYLGSLLIIPMAYLFASGSNSGDDEGVGLVVGAVLGYVVGATAGAVIGWNVSRERKPHRRADVARLDALAAARDLPWREPPRARGPLLEGAEARLAVPLLAFRF